MGFTPERVFPYCLASCSASLLRTIWISSLVLWTRRLCSVYFVSSSFSLSSSSMSRPWSVLSTIGARLRFFPLRNGPGRGGELLLQLENPVFRLRDLAERLVQRLPERPLLLERQAPLFIKRGDVVLLLERFQPACRVPVLVHQDLGLILEEFVGLGGLEDLEMAVKVEVDELVGHRGRHDGISVFDAHLDDVGFLDALDGQVLLELRDRPLHGRLFGRAASKDLFQDPRVRSIEVLVDFCRPERFHHLRAAATGS